MARRKNAIAQRATRRSLKHRVRRVAERVEDRALGMADRAMDAVEANLDRWLDAAAGKLLEKVGLAPPVNVTVRGQDGKTIELVKRPDGSYGTP